MQAHLVALPPLALIYLAFLVAGTSHPQGDQAGAGLLTQASISFFV